MRCIDIMIFVVLLVLASSGETVFPGVAHADRLVARGNSRTPSPERPHSPNLGLSLKPPGSPSRKPSTSLSLAPPGSSSSSSQHTSQSAHGHPAQGHPAQVHPTQGHSTPAHTTHHLEPTMPRLGHIVAGMDPHSKKSQQQPVPGRLPGRPPGSLNKNKAGGTLSASGKFIGRPPGSTTQSREEGTWSVPGKRPRGRPLGSTAKNPEEASSSKKTTESAHGKWSGLRQGRPPGTTSTPRPGSAPMGRPRKADPGGVDVGKGVLKRPREKESTSTTQLRLGRPPGSTSHPKEGARPIGRPVGSTGTPKEGSRPVGRPRGTISHPKEGSRPMGRPPGSTNLAPPGWMEHGKEATGIVGRPTGRPPGPNKKPRPEGTEPVTRTKWWQKAGGVPPRPASTAPNYEQSKKYRDKYKQQKASKPPPGSDEHPFGPHHQPPRPPSPGAGSHAVSKRGETRGN